MLAQWYGQTDSGSETVAVITLILALGWVIFVIWWMVSLRSEIQRIRMTMEHRVYGTLDIDDLDDNDDEDDEPDEIDQLRRIGELHRDGVLTDDEFAQMKGALLRGRS